jgi:hypothetical protein
LRTGFALVLAIGLIAGVLPSTTQAADTTKQLQRLRGDVGYATQKDGSDYKQVFGKFELPDPDYAVTHAKSAAQIAMPDSSLIELGENTSIQVGAFDNTTASPGSTITVNDGSRLRFEIKRPEGGAANYRFVTATSQVAVRGTVGLLAFVNGVTTVGCVVCAADSVVVQVGSQTFALVTGQFLTVSALGAVTTGALGRRCGRRCRRRRRGRSSCADRRRGSGRGCSRHCGHEQQLTNPAADANHPDFLADPERHADRIGEPHRLRAQTGARRNGPLSGRCADTGT